MRGKALNIVAFDFKGRPLGKYRTAEECARHFQVHSTTVYRLVRNGKALVRNGITFDLENDDE